MVRVFGAWGLGLLWTLSSGVLACGGNGGKLPSSSVSDAGAGGHAGSAGTSGASLAGSDGLLVGHAGANGGSTSGGSTSGGSTSGGSTSGGTGGAGALVDNCPLGEIDCSGACVAVGKPSELCKVIATPPSAAVNTGEIAVDADYVYWIETFPCAIARAPRAGGARQQLAACTGTAYALALNKSSLVWSEGDTGHARLKIIAKGGGTATTLLDNLFRPAAPLAVNDSRAYYLVNAQPDDSDVQSIDLSGMNPLTHGKSLLGASRNLLLDANSVYWSSGGTEIRQAPLLGTTQTTLAMVPLTQVLAFMGGSIYTNEGVVGNSLHIARVSLPDGTVSLAALGEAFSWLLASGTTLYLGSGKAVFSLPPAAERPQSVFTTRGKLSGMAGDASGIFVALKHSKDDDGSFIVQLLK